MGGLTAGYNWQFAPHWLVGLEGEFGYLGINRSNIEFNDDTNVGLKTDWYGTARGPLWLCHRPILALCHWRCSVLTLPGRVWRDASNNTVASTFEFQNDGELDCWLRCRNQIDAGMVREDGISFH